MIYLDDFQRDFLETLKGKSAKKHRRFMRQFARAMRKRIMEEAKDDAPKWFGRPFNKVHTPLNIAYSERKRSLFVWGLPPNANVGKKYRMQEEPKGRQAFYAPTRRVIGANVSTGSPFFMVRKTMRRGAPAGFFLSKSSHTEIHEATDSSAFYTKSGGRKYPFAPLWYVEDGKAKFARLDLSVSDMVLKNFDLFASDVFDDVMDEFLKKEIRQ